MIKTKFVYYGKKSILFHVRPKKHIFSVCMYSVSCFDKNQIYVHMYYVNMYFVLFNSKSKMHVFCFM